MLGTALMWWVGEPFITLLDMAESKAFRLISSHTLVDSLQLLSLSPRQIALYSVFHGHYTGQYSSELSHSRLPSLRREYTTRFAT